MMAEKVKLKIQKLLALAQSDNPHEALRAKTQAVAMMKKYGVSEGELQIVEVESLKVERKKLRDSEAILADAIAKITGTFLYVKTTLKVIESGNWYTSRVIYVGSQHSAEIAAYSLEVLARQMEKAVSEFRSEYPGLQFSKVERFMAAYAFQAAKKVVSVMGTQQVPEDVVAWKKTKTMGKHQTKVSKPQGSLDQALVARGFEAGDKAQLHVAASDNRERREALPNLC